MFFYNYTKAKMKAKIRKGIWHRKSLKWNNPLLMSLIENSKRISTKEIGKMDGFSLNSKNTLNYKDTLNYKERISKH